MELRANIAFNARIMNGYMPRKYVERQNEAELNTAGKPTRDSTT